LVPPQERTQRKRNLVRLEPGRGNLVQEGHEGLVVVAIDQSHLDRRTPELARRLDSPETPADDDHSRSRHRLSSPFIPAIGALAPAPAAEPAAAVPVPAESIGQWAPHCPPSAARRSA